jgi:hypothetical protein
MKANGFTEIIIEGSDNNPAFSRETLQSFERGAEKRFILFTGEGTPRRRNLILNVFNGNFDKLPGNMRDVLQRKFGEEKNKKGSICWVIGITGAGAEGISLKCCRSVHIMEPYWNTVRLEQVKGRAIRICSHKDLPYDERTVELYTYYTTFSDQQLAENKINETIVNADKSITSDNNVLIISKNKDKINNAILTIMKESAVDCALNAGENEKVTCLEIEGPPDQYLFDPNLEVDKALTAMTFKEVVSAPAKKTSGVLERIFGMSNAPVSERVVRVGQIRLKSGDIYLVHEKEDSGGSVVNLYHQNDNKLQNPVGRAQVDIVTGKIFGVRLYSSE